MHIDASFPLELDRLFCSRKKDTSSLNVLTRIDRFALAASLQEQWMTYFCSRKKGVRYQSLRLQNVNNVLNKNHKISSKKNSFSVIKFVS